MEFVEVQIVVASMTSIIVEICSPMLRVDYVPQGLLQDLLSMLGHTLGPGPVLDSLEVTIQYVV